MSIGNMSIMAGKPRDLDLKTLISEKPQLRSYSAASAVSV